jgi:MerR family transcriptional regulator, redox-sensitive transcriptional activator SoxR
VADRTPPTAGLTIGAVARQAKVRTSTLRFYESVGLLAAPRRVSGRRVYDADVLDVLRLVNLAKGAGFTVAEIRRLLHGFDRATPASARWQAMAARKLRDVTVLIERARGMQQVLEALLTCECVELADCARPPRPATARRGNGSTR